MIGKMFDRKAVVYYEATLYDIRLNIKLLHDSSIGFSQTIDNPDD